MHDRLYDRERVVEGLRSRGVHSLVAAAMVPKVSLEKVISEVTGKM
jgi:hypothetical protein